MNQDITIAQQNTGSIMCSQTISGSNWISVSTNAKNIGFEII
jgi:hypothetical protein